MRKVDGMTFSSFFIMYESSINLIILTRRVKTSFPVNQGRANNWSDMPYQLVMPHLLVFFLKNVNLYVEVTVCAVNAMTCFRLECHFSSLLGFICAYLWYYDYLKLIRHKFF